MLLFFCKAKSERIEFENNGYNNALKAFLGYQQISFSTEINTFYA
jgi:hypothetical protein